MTRMNRHQLKVMCYGVWLVEKDSGKAIKAIKTSPLGQCPKTRTLQLWFKEFKTGKFQFEDKPKKGKPVTVKTESNVQLIRGKVDANRDITIKKLSTVTGIKRSSIRNIIVQKLEGKKLKPILNPHKLTVEQMKERKIWSKKMLKMFEKNPAILDKVVTGDETYLFFEQIKNNMKWTFPDEDTPRGIKPVRYTYKKRMFFIFFNRKGLIHVDFQPMNNAAKSFDYIEQLDSVIGIVVEKDRILSYMTIMHQFILQMRRKNI